MENLREQFSQIYDQYIEKIYRFVYLKVNSQEIAEDITSRVFLKGWESYRKSQTPMTNDQSGIQNMGAFLYQIARNSVIDHYREKGRTKIVSSENSAQLADPSMGVHEKAVLSADMDAIKSAIQKLKGDYQDIIIWHYLDDMPVTQIAETLGKPAGTVRVMLHRGLKELKGIIKES